MNCSDMHLRITSAARPRIFNSPLGLAVALALLMVFPIIAASSAWAVNVPAGSYSFDGNLPGSAFVSFDGTNFTTPGALPTSTFGVLIDGGPLQQNYPSTSFQITGTGFPITSAYVFDPALDGVTVGDAIFGSIGAGSFEISDPFGIIISGVFTSATLTSTVGATAGSLTASNINGLVLTEGPAFTFDDSFVDSIDASPTGFSISLSSIPVAIGAVGPPGGLFILVTLSPFGLSTGSTVVSGKVNVVPEPSTFALLGFGLLALATPAMRRLRRKSQR